MFSNPRVSSLKLYSISQIEFSVKSTREAGSILARLLLNARLIEKWRIEKKSGRKGHGLGGCNGGWLSCSMYCKYNTSAILIATPEISFLSQSWKWGRWCSGINWHSGTISNEVIFKEYWWYPIPILYLLEIQTFANITFGK